jgi:hypothetical protein
VLDGGILAASAFGNPDGIAVTGRPYLERGEYSPSLYLALKVAEYVEVPFEVISSTIPFARIGTETG